MDKRLAAVLTAVGLLACSGATDVSTVHSPGPVSAAVCTAPTTSAPELGTTFNVRFGEQATISSEGLTLKFNQLLGDSRCPVDVVCVWEGQAEILVRASHPPDPAADVQIHTRSDDPNNQAGYLGYTIALERVVPDKRSTHTTQLDDHCAELRVERVP
jgi:hypothetical protein